MEVGISSFVHSPFNFPTCYCKNIYYSLSNRKNDIYLENDVNLLLYFLIYDSVYIFYLWSLKSCSEFFLYTFLDCYYDRFGNNPSVSFMLLLGASKRKPDRQ